VTAGGAATLTWTTTGATACTGSGGTFTGSQATGSGSIAVSVATTTTYTLSCTGPGGSASKSVTVTATAAVTSSGVEARSTPPRSQRLRCSSSPARPEAAECARRCTQLKAGRRACFGTRCGYPSFSMTFAASVFSRA